MNTFFTPLFHTLSRRRGRVIPTVTRTVSPQIDVRGLFDGVYGSNPYGGGTVSNTAATFTFDPSVTYKNSIRVIYGNMKNGALGDPTQGAILYINGVAVTTGRGVWTTAPYDTSGRYTKFWLYEGSGVLESIGIDAGLCCSHESFIGEVIIDGEYLQAYVTGFNNII